MKSAFFLIILSQGAQGIQGQRGFPGAKGDRGEERGFWENLNYIWSAIFIFEINLSTTGQVGLDGLPVSEHHLGVMSNDDWNFASSTFHAWTAGRDFRGEQANNQELIIVWI